MLRQTKFHSNSVKPQNLIVALALTLMSAGAMSAPAFAGDNKVYSGSNCMPESNPVPAGVFLTNRINNASGKTIRVRCPVTRDVTGSPEGGGPDAAIEVSSPSVNCRFNSARIDGLTFASRTATPFQVSSGVFKYDIKDVPQVTQGAYIIACTLPTSTSIFRYSVTE